MKARAVSLWALALLLGLAVAVAASCGTFGGSSSSAAADDDDNDDAAPDDDSSPSDDDTATDDDDDTSPADDDDDNDDNDNDGDDNDNDDNDDNDDDNDDNDNDNDDSSPTDDDDDDDSAAGLNCNNDGSVCTDPSTGLIWQNGGGVGANSYNWLDAQSYCEGLSWGGMTGWALPDIDALRSLIRGCAATYTGGTCGVTDSCLSDASCWNDTCTGCSYLGGPGSDGAYWPPAITGDPFDWYWSSSAVADQSGDAWGIGFTTGYVYGGITQGSSHYARCVMQPGRRPNTPG
jgi:hypothetical protein